MAESLSDPSSGIPCVITPHMIFDRQNSDSMYYKYIYMIHPDSNIPMTEDNDHALRRAYRDVYNRRENYLAEDAWDGGIGYSSDLFGGHNDCSEFTVFANNSNPAVLGGFSILYRRDALLETTGRELTERQLGVNNGPRMQQILVTRTDAERRTFTSPNHFLHEGDLIKCVDTGGASNLSLNTHM